MSAPVMSEQFGAPPPLTVKGAIDDLRLEAIVEFCELAASYSRSAAEAAWRGDRQTLQVHLAQLRLTTIETLGVFKELSSQVGGP